MKTYVARLAQQWVLSLGGPAVAAVIIVVSLLRNEELNWALTASVVLLCAIFAGYRVWDSERRSLPNKARPIDLAIVATIVSISFVIYSVSRAIEATVPYPGLDLQCSFDHRLTPDTEFQTMAYNGVLQLGSFTGGSTANGYRPHSYLTCVAANSTSQPIYETHFKFAYVFMNPNGSFVTDPSHTADVFLPNSIKAYGSHVFNIYNTLDFGFAIGATSFCEATIKAVEKRKCNLPRQVIAAQSMADPMIMNEMPLDPSPSGRLQRL
ncbi:MAG: hypothetical protein IAI48_11965 [Candidatus Eremiobacteraeota bacterium]|nr:hypothetical protein [Candidatus Eremiobacteraeota bacterium]